MRVAVMGAGATGAYFGGRLAQTGHDVTFIARGEHLRAMQTNGLTVRSTKGDFVLSRVAATGNPADVGPVDVVLFTVKSYDTEASAAQARPLVGPGTAVLTLQNGVDNPDILARVLGPACVVGGSCQIEATVAAPGVIEHRSSFARVVLGEMDGSVSPRVQAIHDALAAAGVDVKISTDIRRSLWEKMTFLATISAVLTAAQVSIGPVREVPEAWALIPAMLREVWSTGRAAGMALDDGLPERLEGFIRGLPPGMKASMLRDRERGRRLEVEALQGEVVRTARRHGVAVPVTEVLYGLLRIHAQPGDAGAT